MTTIASIDGPNRLIHLHADTVGAEVHPIDIYTEMRTLRRTDESLQSFDVFLKGNGNEPKGGGKFTERFVTCLLGTRIVPYDTSHTLNIVGTIITDTGQSGISCFDRAPLTPTSIVDIDYQPPQVEVIEVASGSGLSPTEQDQLRDIFRILGLDAANPVTITDALIAVAGISQAITNPDADTTVVTRAP